MAQDFEQMARAELHTSLKTILLVEDDEDIGEVLVQAISQETPYLPVLVSDGFSALKIVQGVKPHLFILDYQLPRMNGVELYDRLHSMSELAQVPAIMVSARLPYQELKKRNILAMTKPIDLDDFLLTIEQLLA
ncbi:MAG: response regulator [Chloroflexi bacterium]|nr:MAG: response regulator [Chloroflexota bacterium]